MLSGPLERVLDVARWMPACLRCEMDIVQLAILPDALGQDGTQTQKDGTGVNVPVRPSPKRCRA